jgi:UDP-N-acetylglucosamine--N-acetylmuramyl-(pentapeptide) pyrophosphoryl-undecaprenol N-acetylglucosamine transferase
MTPSKSPLLIFTGGHHTSALALAKKLQERGWQIYWVGHRHSQWRDTADSAEYREVKEAGIEFFDLKAGKIFRTFHPLKLLRLPWGFITAFILVLKLKIHYGKRLKGIVTFGGYLGVPVVFNGFLFGIPVLAHEQTPVAGWANKFIAFFAQKIALTWPSGSGYYPVRKTILTGLPLRDEILNAVKNKPRLDHIYITGGKQGAHVINSAVFSVLEELLKDFTLIHQTGTSALSNDFKTANELRDKLPENLKNKYIVRDYLSPLETARALSDSGLVISRSGAHIIQELALFQTRCVLIPIPWSSHNEQLINARLLENNQQAEILNQSQLNGTTLIGAIQKAMLLKPGQLNIISDGMEKMIQLIEQMFGHP